MAAMESSVGHCMIQISPTFISSDLFHPAWIKNKQYSTSRRSNFWGTEATSYGGIGKLPSISASLESINASRGHRHYNSGIHCNHVDANPFVVTDVSFLPGVSFKIVNDPCLVQDPFTSHISRFEVFPRFDLKRNELDDPSERFLNKEINPPTKIALDQLSNRIYRQTEYQNNYKHPETNDRTRTSIQHYNPWEYVLGNNINTQELEENEEEQEEDEVKDDTDTAEEQSPVSELQGEKIQQKAPQKLKPIDFTKQNPKDFLARHKFALMLPKVTDFGKKMLDTPQIITIPRKIHQDNRKLPALRDHDVKLIRRQKLPAMVGMQFKSDAHFKYHRNHPESIPDLRDSITVGKQHRFFGVHASLLR